MDKLNDRLTPIKDSQYIKLLERAASAFARNGYDGASVRAITEAAGINPAMVAYYFQSKAGLFRTVLDDRRGLIHERLSWAEQAGRPGDAPELRHRAYLNCVLVEYPEFLHILWSHALLSGDGFPYADCRKVLFEQPAMAGSPKILGDLADALFASPTPLLDRPQAERQALADKLGPSLKRRQKPRKPAETVPEEAEPVRYPAPNDDFLDGFVD